MWIPDKAIIKVPIREDAKRLLAFLNEYGYHWYIGGALTERDNWEDNNEETVYDLEPARVVQYCSEEWYRTTIDDYLAGRDVEEDVASWLPEDPTLRFCTVDEFLAICMETEDMDDSGMLNPESIL